MSAQIAFTFDGTTYDPSRDRVRLTRQLQMLKRFLSDGRWYSLTQIAAALGCTESGASARVRDLRKERFGSHEIERKNCGGGVWVYRMKV
jgi:hypothetical protein